MSAPGISSIASRSGESFNPSRSSGRLLKAGERSHWHRLHTAVEVWHYYAGAPLKLMQSGDGKTVETQLLGPDILKGERPQGVIPAGSWQAAETTGDFTLVGCTVAPGFTFEDFELAEPEWAPGG